MSSELRPTSSPGRLHYIDGLRGVAALSVLIYHINYQSTSPISAALQHMMPSAVWWVLMHGNLGVDIFFVLSGFVISRSLRRDYVTPGLFTRFAARRSLRLDIPYWAVVGLVVLMKWTLHAVSPNHPLFAGKNPDTIDLLTNFAYLQNVFQRPNVLVVSWTLCLELVFYISYVSILAVAQQTTRLTTGRRTPRPSKAALIGCFIPTLLLSFWCFYIKSFGMKEDNHNGLHLFLSYWHLFLLGAILQWVIEGWTSKNWLFAVVTAILLLSLYQSVVNKSIELAGICGAATAVSIYLAMIFNRMDRWLSNAFIQLAGKVSYTLYLVHVPVCMVVLGTTRRMFGLTANAALIGSPVVVLITAVITGLVYYFIERPSLRLSQKVPVHAKKTETELAIDPVGTSVQSA